MIELCLQIKRNIVYVVVVLRLLTLLFLAEDGVCLLWGCREDC